MAQAQYSNDTVLPMSTLHGASTQHRTFQSCRHLAAWRINAGAESREWQVVERRPAASLSSFPVPLRDNGQQLAFSERVWSGSRQSHKQAIKRRAVRASKPSRSQAIGKWQTSKAAVCRRATQEAANPESPRWKTREQRKWRMNHKKKNHKKGKKKQRR